MYTLLCASCLTELGIMLPQAGGYYVYVRRAFGNTAGFAVGWTDWLMYCSILAYVSIAIAEFLAVIGPIPSGAIDSSPFQSCCCCGLAMAWNPHQQSVSRGNHFTKMRRVFGSSCHVFYRARAWTRRQAWRQR